MASGIWKNSKIPYVLKAVAPTTSDISYSVPTMWVNTATNRIYFLVDITAGSATWYESATSALPMATSTDPAGDAAVSTAIVNAYSGVIITLTGAGNAQTIQAPTDTTAGKPFTVVTNDSNGAYTIEVNGITMSAGEAQRFLWDGSAWIMVSAVDADDIAFTPAGDIVATNVQDAIEELDDEKMKRITSVDNEIARFDSTGGDVQGYTSNPPTVSDDGEVLIPGSMGVGTDSPDTILTLKNDNWVSGKNFAGTDSVNLLKVNVDDEIDVGGTLNLGTIEGPEDGGAITLYDMSVSATPTSGDEMSFTHKIDGDSILTVGAFADSAGGVGGHFVQNHGAHFDKKTNAGAADYNPSALTSDYIITVDTTAAARAVIISTEDRDTGSADKVRTFIIQDIAGNAGANNITISLETSGNISGAATAVINANYNSVTLIVDGTNGAVI